MVKVIMPQLTEKSFVHFANKPGMQRKLDNLADRHISMAKRIYLSQAHDPNTVSPYYAGSFKKIRSRYLDYEARQVINTDPMWLWIEFGAHAGGRTPILKYRPMSRAMDELKNQVR